MKKKKTALKTIKSILRMFDFFGETLSFRYKEEDKLSTVFGGIIFIIFIFIALLYSIYNCIPFLKRKNYSLQYYSMNLVKTENVKLYNSPTAFAFGLDQDTKDKITQYNIFDLLEVKTQYHITINGTKDKNKIDYHNCTTKDFHYLHNKTFYNSKINDYKCLSRENLTKNSPQGIYTDEIFSYYVISIESKDPNNATHNQLINDYLTEFDCRLQFYYTDVIMDLDNVKNPFSSVLNSMFLQLNPTLVQKRNIFFLNYHLYDDKYWFHLGGEKEKETQRTGLSRTEDYSLYKGLNRTYKINDDYTDDYNVYAKIYIRVDNKNVEIKRRYQDVMEFYADTSALLLSLFWLLGIIFAYYDRIKANHSISKKLFYFEGTKDNNFSQFKQLKDILNSNEIKDYNNNQPEKEKEKILINNKDKLKLPVINQYSKPVFKNEEKKGEEGNSVTYSRIVNIPNSKNSLTKTITNSLINNKNKEDEKIEESEEEVINYSSYNICEMLGSFKIFCKTKKFEHKISLINKSKSIIDDKLDIVFYIRNMILFELINKIYLENQNIINFLSRQIIYYDKEGEKKEKTGFDFDDIESKDSLEIMTNKLEEEKKENKKEENKIKNEKKDLKRVQGELYKSAYKFNYDVLSRKVKNLMRNPNKTQTEGKIVNLLEQQLSGIK